MVKTGKIAVITVDVSDVNEEKVLGEALSLKVNGWDSLPLVLSSLFYSHRTAVSKDSLKAMNFYCTVLC